MLLAAAAALAPDEAALAPDEAALAPDEALPHCDVGCMDIPSVSA